MSLAMAYSISLTERDLLRLDPGEKKKEVKRTERPLQD